MKIEIWSDIACPFCYIGGRHLELAMENMPFRDEVEIHWRSFQLDPQAEVDQDTDTITMLARKYGMSREQAEANQAQVAERAGQVGLTMSPQGGIPTNTLDAHRLLHLAAGHGLQHALKQRLFRAHFAERVNVGHREVLRGLAAEVGLPAADVDRVLDSQEFALEVAGDQQQAGNFGVRGVPFFVLDRKYGLSGAQPVEVFEQALRESWAERGQSGQ